MPLYETPQKEPLIERDNGVCPPPLRKLVRSGRATPTQSTDMSIEPEATQTEDSSTQSETDINIFQGETIEELVENTTEAIFEALDTIHTVRRMDTGYWDDRTAKKQIWH